MFNPFKDLQPRDPNSPWEEEDSDWRYDVEKEERETSGLSTVWKDTCLRNITFMAVGAYLWSTWMSAHYGPSVTWGWDAEKDVFEVARDSQQQPEEFATLLVCTQSSLSDTLVWGFQHNRDEKQEQVLQLPVPEIARHAGAGEGSTPIPCARSFNGTHAATVVASLLRAKTRYVLHMFPTDEAGSGYVYLLIDAKEGLCFQNVSPRTLFDALCVANAKFCVTKEGVLKVFEELAIPVKQDASSVEWLGADNKPLLRIEFNNVNRISCIKVARMNC